MDQSSTEWTATTGTTNPGFTAEQIIGKTDADLLPEQEAAALTAVKHQVQASGKGARQNVRTTIAGTAFVYDLTIEPLHDAAGTVVGITCASLDVTRRGRERTDSGTNGSLANE